MSDKKKLILKMFGLIKGTVKDTELSRQLLRFFTEYCFLSEEMSLNDKEELKNLIQCKENLTLKQLIQLSIDNFENLSFLDKFQLEDSCIEFLYLRGDLTKEERDNFLTQLKTK